MATLVTNAIDTLSGGDDLIGLRTRGTAVRPFTLVQNIQRSADERYQDTEKGLEEAAQGNPGQDP